MKRRKKRIGLGVLLALLGGLVIAVLLARSGRDFETGGDHQVRVAAGIDHGAYDRLLKKYVDAKGLVDYEGWKANNEDMQKLKQYLAQFGQEPTEVAEGNDLTASLINGYNAFMIEMILDKYPIDSVMAMSHPFDGRRMQVGGEKVSPNDLEHATLIPHFGYRSHAVLVCVARSCPPLRQGAYLPQTLDTQVDDSFRTWLAREDLNRFFPDENRVEISSIFDWFPDDFEEAGGLPEVLARYGPEEVKDFLEGGDYSIEFIPYDWALNDQNPREIGRLRVGWNRFLDFVR